MKDNKLDRIIAQKLENLQSPPEEGAWSAFEEKLSNSLTPQNDKPESDRFDDLIKEKIASVQPVIPSDSWDRFEQAMEATNETEPAPKENTSFDELVAGKLARVQGAMNEDSWDRFEEAMTAATESPNPENTFDAIIANQLKFNYPLYNYQHWLLLKEKLDYIAFVTNRILTYKTGELAALLLLLFVYGEYSPSLSNTQPLEAPNDIVLQEEAKPALSDSDELKMDNKAVIAEVASNKAESPAVMNDNAKETGIAVEPIYNENSPAISSNAYGIHLSDELIKAEHDNFTTLNLLHKDEEKLHKPASANIESFDKSIEHAIDVERHLLDTLSGIASPMERLLANVERPDASALLVPHEPRRTVSISMVGALEYNRIITNEIRKYKLGAFDRYEPGYGGGFLLDIKWKRWGMQTGALYSAKTIRPQQVTYLGGFRDGYPGELLEEYDYNTINIPLNVTYEILKGEKWRLYAGMGASLQFVYEANYFVVLDLSNAGGFGVLNNSNGIISTTTTKSRLDEIDFPSGVFQNGSLRESGFISGNLSIGLERRILEDRWSVFVQPTYHHGLIYFNEGLGPFRDKIRTMSILAGIRVNFFK